MDTLPSKFMAHRPRSDTRQQTTCGSCWAHATVAALSSRHPGPEFSQATDNEILRNSWHNHGCAGGSVKNAYIHCMMHGLQAADGRRYKLRGWKDLAGAGIFELKHELFNHGALAVHMHEYPSMRHASGTSAWRPRPDETAIGVHAVAIIGWDDRAGGWIVQNSWGNTWADAGVGIIAYGAAEIEHMAVLCGWF